jgi:hypothetical protein
MPDPEHVGFDYATYQVCDEGGLCATAQIEFAMTFVNDLPEAYNDSYNAFQGSTINENVSLNDIERDDEVNWWNVLLPPSHAASFTFNIDGTFTYTPVAGYTGPDQFMYQACDPCGACDFAFVYITVLPPNNPPIANNDNKYATEDVTLNNQVHSNDSDPDGDALTFSLETEPEHGSIIFNSNGTFSYTPDLDYYGPDSFIYNACDSYGLCDDAVVSITVAFVNDWPVAVDDYETMEEDEVLVATVATNDYDLDLEILDYLDIYGPYHGTLSFNFNGTYTYTPDADYFGTDQFGYVCIDPCGITDFGDVFITISSVNDLPVAVGENFNTNEDASLNGDVSLNDDDLESAALSYNVLNDVANGSLNLNLNGSFTYTPVSNFFGPDSFTYTVTDGNGGSSMAVANITVQSVNDAPVALNDDFNLNEDGILIANVSSNDADSDGDLLSYTFDFEGLSGEFTANSNGQFEYSPPADFFGQIAFSYEACDASTCTTANVSITVNSVNDAPVANDEYISILEEQSLIGSLFDYSYDVDGDELVFSLLNEPLNGLFSLNPEGNFTYQPDNDYNGTELIVFEVCDASGACDQAILTIDIQFLNDNPIPADDSFSMDEDAILNANVSLNDFEPDGEQMMFYLLAPPQSGTVIMSANGEFSYTPVSNFNGDVNFSYTACDPCGACISAEVSIHVNAINDAPMALDLNQALLMNTPINGTLSTLVSDVDGDELEFSIIAPANEGVLQIEANGDFSYAPSLDFYGNDAAIFQVCDDGGLCVIANINFVIANTNESPLPVEDIIEIEEDNSIVYDLASNDTDPNGDNLSYSVFEEPSNGACIISPNGVLTFNPELHYYGTVNMKYQVCDQYNACAIADITIHISSVNDAPVANSDNVQIAEDTEVFDSLAPLCSDIENDELSFSILSLPEYGQFNMDEFGNYHYVPTANFHGIDFLDFQVCDGFGDCDISSVYFEVVSVNDAPVAIEDVFGTFEDMELNATVAANDFDIDGFELTFQLIESAQNGLLIMNADGTFSYVPDLGFVGTEMLAYSVCDSENACSLALLTIVVESANTAPQAQNVEVESCALVNTEIDLATYILDAQTATELLNISIVSISEGTAELNEQTLNLSYSQAFSGLITIIYQVCDNNFNPLCAEASIQVEVAPVFIPEIASEILIEPSCHGESNGSITLELTDDTYEYSFFWNNGVETQNLTNIPAGDYSVAILSNAPCGSYGDYSFELAEPESLEIIGLEALPINENPGGSNMYSVAGGTEPYSYVWTDSDGNIVSANITLELSEAEQIGNYTLQVTDANNCTISQTIMVTDMEELTSNLQFVAYPNPVENQVIITSEAALDGVVNCSVFDLSGKLVVQQNLMFSGNQVAIDLSTLAQGAYQIVILNDLNIGTLRVIKN